MSSSKPAILSGFGLGLLGIWLVALALRFWGLSRLNELVFDEVYFAKFAHNYLTKTAFFDAHPPLGKYLIAMGMWIGDRLPLGDPAFTNHLTGSLRSTFSYRWLNALTGSFIPLVVSALAYQLTYQRGFALIAGSLMTLEGLFLVESRYALVNVYLVLFGLLGHGFGILALQSTKSRRFLWFCLSGITFGLAGAVKWNGWGFLLGFLCLLFAIKIHKTFSNRSFDIGNFLWYNAATKISLWSLVTYSLIVPLLIYTLIWIPHLQWNPDYNFWEMQKEILGYHQRIGSSKEVHAYCSSWLSWPLLLRAIAYYYQPLEEGGKIIDVHAFGNPILWWLATGAIATFFILVFQPSISPKLRSLSLYLLINYGANWLPWSQVKRCLFLYHYMGALVFSILALAFLIDQGLDHPRAGVRKIAIATLVLIAIAFLFWLPIYLGLPLSPLGFRLRMWLPSWV